MEFVTENETRRISLKKLCKRVDKFNPTFNNVDIKKLIDEMMKWNKEDHIIFHLFFIKNMTIKDISTEFNISRYRVSKSINNSVKNISFNSDIIK